MKQEELIKLGMRDVAAKLGIDVIASCDARYPHKLFSLSDVPSTLYVRGRLADASQKRIGIIGTRAATPRGMELAYRFAQSLASWGIVIVSGLARGIDTAAHQGALKTGQTEAIIGSGHLHLYPQENEKLSVEIARNGAVISEMELDARPTRYSFPRRNRLIAAMSDLLLLIEAPLQSGAMGTMRWGAKLGKPLFALSGTAGAASMQGAHALIKEGTATLVDEPSELMKALGGCAPKGVLCKMEESIGTRGEILRLLTERELTLEQLSDITNNSIARLHAELVMLLLDGVVAELPGKRYRVMPTLSMRSSKN